ncbi:MAG: hypothetical protein WBV06_06890 [Acidimicrobiia bacterium]
MISSWTMTRRWAGVLIAMMMIAVPASASVITQNFMAADASVNAACFTKTAGADASSGSGFLAFDGGATIQDVSGTVDLIQETMSINGFAGDRLIYSDAVHFNNNCGSPVAVTFVSENDPNGGLAVDPAYVAGDFWDDISISIYLATVAAPTGTPGSSGDWQLMMSVAQGSVSDQFASVSIPDGATRSLAVVIDTDDGVTTTDTGTLRWTAQATHP